MFNLLLCFICLYMLCFMYVYIQYSALSVVLPPPCVGRKQGGAGGGVFFFPSSSLSGAHGFGD